jgi:hypothetical protein
LQVAKHEDAKDVWESIRVHFLGVDRVQKARLQTLRSNLEKLQMGDGEKLDDFAGKITNIMAKFKELGSTIEEEVVVRKLLNSVPGKFMPIVASIEQFADLDTMPLEGAIGRLKAFEERLSGNDGSNENQSKLLLSQSDNHGKQAGDSNRNRGRGRGYNNRRRDEPHVDNQQEEEGDDQENSKGKDQDSRGQGRGFGRGR